LWDAEIPMLPLSGALEDMKPRGTVVLIFSRRVAFGDVCAARLVTVGVAGERVGTGARSAADFLELALAAFAFEVGGIAQTAE